MVFRFNIFALFLSSVLFLNLYYICETASSEPTIETFDVKPGGVEYGFKTARDGVTCEFTYVCQGGTNEKWKMVIVKIKNDNTYGCFVERESGVSYLFFQKFLLNVKGPANLLSGQAFGNKGRDLNSDEIVIDKAKKSVYPSAKFGSQLARATLEYEHVGKEEL